MCTTCSTDAISTIKALEATLGRGTPDKSDPSEFAIKLALAAEPCGDVNVNKLQATDAIIKATEAASVLGSAPTVVGLLSSGVDTSTNVTAKVQTFETTGGVLLKRMELFNKIVADIAQVFSANYLALHSLTTTQIHPYTSLAWSVISSATQVCLLLFHMHTIVNR